MVIKVGCNPKLNNPIILPGVSPLIALHAVAFARDHRTAQAVARTGVATDKAQAVGLHETPFADIDGRAFGIVDALVGFEHGLFAFARQQDGLFDVDFTRGNTGQDRGMRWRPVDGHSGR